MPDSPQDVLAYCKVTLTRHGELQFETTDDEIVGRGLIDALRAHFDQKCQQQRFQRVIEQQQIRSVQSQLKNGGRA